MVTELAEAYGEAGYPTFHVLANANLFVGGDSFCFLYFAWINLTNGNNPNSPQQTDF